MFTFGGNAANVDCVTIGHCTKYVELLTFCKVSRKLTNRRLLRYAAVRLRDMLTAHVFLRTCHRAKVDDVGESDLPASWKQEDVSLVFKVFSRCFKYFCQII